VQVEEGGPFISLDIPEMKYLKMYKPRNVLSSNAPDKDLLPASWLLPESLHNDVSHVGRLDYESDGLLIWTNDTTFSKILTRPEVGVMKVYEVCVED